MEPDPEKLPPTQLSKTWKAAQEKAKQTEREELNMPEEPGPQGEQPGPLAPEILNPVDPKELMFLKYTRPLPGSYRTFSIELCSTAEEINNTTAFRAKCLAAIVGEKIFIEITDEHAQDIRPLTGIEKPPPSTTEQPKSTTGKVCDLCGSDLVFKEGYNQEKKKAWAAWFCSKAGPDTDKEQRCSKKPKWVTKK